MNTSLKSILTAVTLAAAALLTGCATPNSQASFTKGEETIYGRVNNVWTGKDMAVAHTVFCGTKNRRLRDGVYSEKIDAWLLDSNFCDSTRLSELQQVQMISGVVDLNGTMYTLAAFAPKLITIEEDDIVAVKVWPNKNGLFDRPPEVLRVAAKAKDATKKNGCYWDAGTGVWSGFNQGGAVCEGWHWKNHPYSNPDLLKK